jgi:hypothetical protein
MNLKCNMTNRLHTHLMLTATLISASLLMPATSQASLLIGTFNFNGNTTISNGLIHFTDAVGNPSGVINVTSSTGDFSGDGGGTGVVKDISNIAFPIPTGAGSLPDFLTSALLPANIHFNMTFLFPGIEGPATCATGPNCTPANSPYNLTNTSPNTSTASFAVSGVEVDTLTSTSTPFFGVFTAQFGTNYQAVLAQFASNGSVTTSFSGTIITATAVPEPGSLPMLASGFLVLGIAFGIRKYNESRV